MLPVDAEVQALQPHAHYRARDVRGDATLPDGTTKELIHIRDWDFFAGIGIFHGHRSSQNQRLAVPNLNDKHGNPAQEQGRRKHPG